MRRVNPAFIPRNHRVEAALNSASEVAISNPSISCSKFCSAPTTTSLKSPSTGGPLSHRNVC